MATIELPAPIEMQMPLVQVLGRRRSRREFSEQPLDGAILSTLLWACVGRNSDDDRRTAPSAFNCREVDCFVFDDKGVWLYDPEDNALVQATQGDKRAMTTTAQDYVGMAPITLVLAVSNAKAEPLVGAMGQICRAVDVGAAMQNALLACAAMGLSAVPRASFDPQQVLQARGKSEEQYAPLMAVTVGFPA